MTRITKALTETIVANAVAKSGLQVDYAPRYLLAEKLRIESLGGPQQAKQVEKTFAKIEKEMRALPKGLATGHHLARRDYEMYRMNLGGMRVNLHFGADTEAAENTRICPQDFTLAGDHPLVAEFERVTNAESETQKAIENLKQQVRATVSSFTTLNKLVESWPEVLELLPSETPAPVSGLPAVQTEVLNKLIGLPTGEGAK